MQAGSLRQIAGPVGVHPIPVDDSRFGKFIEFVVRAGGIKDAETHATDGGKCFASSKSYGPFE